jgi:hypothetical protein
MPISNGTVDVACEPPMRLGGTPLESRAHQVLNVEAGAGNGIDLGVNVFFNRVLVQPSAGERSFGPYVGGDVHVAITRRAAIMAGMRVRLTSGPARTIQVLDLVDPNESTWVPGLPDVAVALDGQPLELPGTRWRTLVGVKLSVRELSVRERSAFAWHRGTRKLRESALA